MLRRTRLVDLAARLRQGFIAPTIHRRSIADRSPFVYGPDVVTARRSGSPIVALESTIITHGMPYPDNLNTALRAEDAVRKHGAVPATIGIIDGKVYVGLNKEQLEVLSTADPTKTVKCSRRDVSTIVSHTLNGGTTVSATMLIAHIAGIQIMATGGIGGVHRGAELTFDVSTDLTELGRTPVAVVCSGVKSILDIEKTLEYLETQGVPVVKIGETPDFPAFYCSKTVDELKAPCRASNAEEAAGIVEAQRTLGVDTGILFAVPIPDRYALDPATMDAAIREALRKANDARVTGKRVTPFLLSELNEITRGRSLEANIALVENNAKVAAEIALSLCERRRSQGAPNAATAPSARSITSRQKPVVVGGAILDTVLQVRDPEISEEKTSLPLLRTLIVDFRILLSHEPRFNGDTRRGAAVPHNNDGRTHDGHSRRSCGGVGRNVADGLVKLGLKNTRLISVVGDDEHGKAILDSLGAAAETVQRLPDEITARSTVVLNSKGECCFCVCEMESLAAIVPELIRERRSHLEEASLLVLDANLPPDTMRYVLDVASRAHVPVWYEPTDIQKAAKIFEVCRHWQDVLHFISPNLHELRVIGRFFGISVTGTDAESWEAEARRVAGELSKHIPVIITTLGERGALVTRRASENEPFYSEDGELIVDSSTAVSRLYPVERNAARPGEEVLSVSGCGDCLTAGVIYGVHRNLVESDCISLGLRAAALSLKSLDTVPPTLEVLSEHRLGR
ncbi:PREDICTED: pseudouridine-metabolizing bifunctional protein C1861.05 isoform X1 [Dinoponera quadriceps]|uniref:Pseudouridine-metabolizing bifunctional protein C1861.05 isoform X1 n=1 Tax=Dinoponera quadriceps TaxID=609295 RepID=A0A6P3WWS6_DINQU|nr:PREDICTED: pseudouridine-metabolizing bifunctional protein C1861.05 isoform X1 [Dinoponera quadriceps]